MHLDAIKCTVMYYRFYILMLNPLALIYIYSARLWGLYVLVLITLAMVNSGYSIGFETDSVIDSFIILIYIAYFISTLTIIPAFIDIWPSAYTNSVLLEDILDLEDKIIKSENTNDDSKRIEIVEEDITEEDKGILAERHFPKIR